MIVRVAISVNRVPIRLRPDRWPYIEGYYDEALDIVERPDYILLDRDGNLVAVRELAGERCFTVTCREIDRRRGYILSASYKRYVNRRALIWRRRW